MIISSTLKIDKIVMFVLDKVSKHFNFISNPKRNIWMKLNLIS